MAMNEEEAQKEIDRLERQQKARDADEGDVGDDVTPETRARLAKLRSDKAKSQFWNRLKSRDPLGFMIGKTAVGIGQAIGGMFGFGRTAAPSASAPQSGPGAKTRLDTAQQDVAGMQGRLDSLGKGPPSPAPTAASAPTAAPTAATPTSAGVAPADPSPTQIPGQPETFAMRQRRLLQEDADLINAGGQNPAPAPAGQPAPQPLAGGAAATAQPAPQPIPSRPRNMLAPWTPTGPLARSPGPSLPLTGAMAANRSARQTAASPSSIPNPGAAAAGNAPPGGLPMSLPGIVPAPGVAAAPFSSRSGSSSKDIDELGDKIGDLIDAMKDNTEELKKSKESGGNDDRQAGGRVTSLKLDPIAKRWPHG